MGNFIKAALGFIILISIFVGCVRSCLGMNPQPTISSSGIEKFYLTDSDPVNLVIGEKNWEYSKFRVKFHSEAIPIDDIVFVSSDESVATVTFHNTLGPSYDPSVYYYINAVGEGTAKVHFESSDGTIKSEEIVVTVTESTTQQQTDVTENE